MAEDGEGSVPEGPRFGRRAGGGNAPGKISCLTIKDYLGEELLPSSGEGDKPPVKSEGWGESTASPEAEPARPPRRREVGWTVSPEGGGGEGEIPTPAAAPTSTR